MRLGMNIASLVYRTTVFAARPALNATLKALANSQRIIHTHAVAKRLHVANRPLTGQMKCRYFSSDNEKAEEEARETDEQPQEDETQNEDEKTPEGEQIDLNEKVASLETKLADATEKLKEMHLKYRMSLDNCEQMEKIYTKKLDNANLYAISRFAKDMLDVADAFELAFKALGAQKEGSTNDEFIEGIRLTEIQLHKTFGKYGVKRFDSLKETFNPEIHEAMFEIPDGTVDKNTVLQVVFNGYMIHDRVLRAAKVGVSRK